MRGGWTDLHNHLIPGVDDGARDQDEAVRALAALATCGVVSVVTTPHLDASVTSDSVALRERLSELDRGWQRLLDVADRAGIADLGRGVELKLDVPTPDPGDSRLRLGGSRALLVEFPHMTVPPRSEHVLAHLRREGYVPLVAHPERYHGLDASLNQVARWLDAGAVLQLNAPSLIGRYGRRVEEVGWALLERGWVHCLSSDYHARRAVGLVEARAALEDAGAGASARLLFEENPTRLLADEEPLPVPPLERPGLLRRLVGRLGRVGRSE